MGDRRQARELALQVLFFLDMNQPGSGSGPSVEDRSMESNIDAFCAGNEDKLIPGVEPFFRDLVEGVTMHQVKIDELLNSCSKNWKISRMPVVDRNIMRIAVYELLHRADIPSSVTINEAVEIGKKFGGRDSGPFINGVLDRVKSMTQTPET